MNNELARVQSPMRCDHEGSLACAKHGAGHGLHPIQARVAAATPSRWRDGLVREVTADGWIAIGLLATDEVVWAWHHADLTATLAVGQPVALHSLYNVLALGGERVSVLISAL